MDPVAINNSPSLVCRQQNEYSQGPEIPEQIDKSTKMGDVPAGAEFLRLICIGILREERQ